MFSFELILLLLQSMGELSQGQPVVAKTTRGRFLPKGAVLTPACCAASWKLFCSRMLLSLPVLRQRVSQN